MAPSLVDVLSTSYTVAGQCVTFACEDRWTLTKLTRLAGGWHFALRPDDPPSAIVVRLSRESTPRLPQGAAAFEVHHGSCFLDGDALVLSTSDSQVRIHPVAAHLIDVWIGPETAASPIAFARLLFYATQAALRRCGLFELHAAAVKPPALPDHAPSSGVLVVGASGSGKTTLAMRLSAAGWSNVADDLVLIREDAGAAEAFAFRRVFAATEATLDACPPPHLDEATREPAAFEPSKRRLDPEVLFPGRFASSCTPGVLVFPVITGEKQTETRPMAAPEALTRLLKMCPWAAYDTAVARPHLSALVRLAKQCASYAMLAGTDLLHDAQAGPRLFGSLAMGTR